MRLRILQGDWTEQLRTLPVESVHCCVTSPPYWGLRDYGVPGQLGLEKTPEEYIAKVVEGFREVRRVLRDDGTCWINLGDSYGGYYGDKYAHKPFGEDRTADASTPPNKPSQGKMAKQLQGIPWRVAFALQADGWYLRSDIIWHKPNPMPESVTDRPTKSHEYIFLLTKSARYFYDAEAIKEQAIEGCDLGLLRGKVPEASSSIAWHAQSILDRKSSGVDSRNGNPTGTRNKRSVWTVATSPYKEAHFATFPPDLIKPCILAGTSARGCCPKCGAPWDRIVEKTDEHDPSAKGSRFDIGKTGNRDGGDRTQAGERFLNQTTGWKPACSCGDDEVMPGPHVPVPCTVLDPFGGSFTTGKVALELGRSAIMIELNPAYVELGKRRCAITPGLALA